MILWNRKPINKIASTSSKGKTQRNRKDIRGVMKKRHDIEEKREVGQPTRAEDAQGREVHQTKKEVSIAKQTERKRKRQRVERPGKGRRKTKKHKTKARITENRGKASETREIRMAAK
ncbi:hypothetical protein Scep_018982 [Stephania cephalantha]|uniref:Uncharacterized protein n=1 Tax=Stephania cephalantha TaxID=152367 RepID=A0AAP0IA22_9MAGN